MIQAEFNQWLDHHRAYFPGLDSWLSKLPDRQATLRAWANLLDDTPLKFAREASDRMAADDTVPVYERHASRIRKLASELRQKDDKRRQTARFGPGAFRCELCRDRGLVSVYVAGNRLQHEIHNLGVEVAARKSSLAACTCDAGGAKQSVAQVYDPQVHVLCESSSWVHFQRTRPDDYDRRMLQVEQAKYDLDNGLSSDLMQPVTSDTEF